MGRLLLAGTLLVAALGTAHAGPTRRVTVDSEPDGAAVYLNDIDSGPVCQPTPCSFNAPIGNAVIIVRKDGFEPVMDELTKGKKPLQKKIKLDSAMGTIRVDVPKGATVRIDKEDKGRAPVDVKVRAGEALHVIVIANDKTVFDDVVEVKTNEEYVVKTKNAGSASAAVAETATVVDDPEDDEGGGGSTGGSEGGSDGITESPEPTEPRGKFLNVGLAFDVAVRNVSYGGVTTPNTLRKLDGGSQALLGPAVEVWPGRLLGVKQLRGLSVFARYQFSVVGQEVTDADDKLIAVSKWSSLELSVRERLQFGSIGVEFGGGYVKDRFHFDANQMNFDSMPEIDYQAVRIGGKLLYSAGSVEPYIGGEFRIVMSGGEIDNRFAVANATAVRGALGLAAKFGSIAARLEGSLMNYSWAFDNQGMASDWNAQSASDSIMGVSFVLGYSF